MSKMLNIHMQTPCKQRCWDHRLKQQSINHASKTAANNTSMAKLVVDRWFVMLPDAWMEKHPSLKSIQVPLTSHVGGFTAESCRHALAQQYQICNGALIQLQTFITRYVILESAQSFMLVAQNNISAVQKLWVVSWPSDNIGRVLLHEEMIVW